MRRPARSLLAALLPAFAAALVLAAGAQAAPTPEQVYRALLKAPPTASLPTSLKGSRTAAGTLSAGPKKHHAIGAVSTTNGAALVGYLVFPTHALALADLKASPPNQGPNKIVSRNPAGFPQPTLVLLASSNGYVAAYVVFVEGNLLVDSWTYGPKGTEKQLIKIALQDAHWAQARGAGAIRGS
jgi:hypothetical protein